jgi:hypothetical protein
MVAPALDRTQLSQSFEFTQDSRAGHLHVVGDFGTRKRPTVEVSYRNAQTDK